ncbi:cystathionine beta-lyase [bacterium]|nr:cystathionine beta-lyase [bacterium]|tara:strand:+ start:7129 stop:8331 length:1203 start_codon:yes stop_codon:yes gene_type:complete
MNIEQRMDACKRIFGEFGGVNPSIHPSTTFTTLKPETMQKMFNGELEEAGCYLYGRHFHPNSLQTGMLMAAIENTEIAYPVSSGMAAISTTIRQIFKDGGHLVSSSEIYGGSYAFFKNILAKQNIDISFCAPNDIDQILEMTNDQTKAIYLEMHSNPNLKAPDLLTLKECLEEKEHSPKIIIDNTFTPLTYTPKNLGADIIIHSGTKFLNGMSDFVSGMICCSHEFLNELMDLNHGELMLSGPALDPISSWKLYQNLHTLPIRIREHSQRAEELAYSIEGLHKFKIIYPGLSSHPDFESINEQFNPTFGYGGILAIDLETQSNAEYFVKECQSQGLALNAVSLGYYETLMSISRSSTSSEIDESTMEENQLSEGLVRISLGYFGDLETQIEKYYNILNKI